MTFVRKILAWLNRWRFSLSQLFLLLPSKKFFWTEKTYNEHTNTDTARESIPWHSVERSHGRGSSRQWNGKVSSFLLGWIWNLCCFDDFVKLSCFGELSHDGSCWTMAAFSRECWCSPLLGMRDTFKGQRVCYSSSDYTLVFANTHSWMVYWKGLHHEIIHVSGRRSVRFSMRRHAYCVAPV